MKKIGKMRALTSLENTHSNSLVSIGFECIDRDVFKTEMCYEPLGKTGIKHARCQTGWCKCEKQKGVYDFGWLDDVVDNLICRSIQPWFCVSYGNTIYMDDVSNEWAVGCVPLLYGVDVMEAWKSYARALAKHFSGRVSHFEIWNEPDGEHFWYPEKPDATQYAAFVAITGNEIKAIIPDAKIGACVSGFYFDYIEKFAQSISSSNLDFYCYHAYSKSPESNYTENVNYIKKIFSKYGLGSVELWQGESGYPTWFPDNHWLRPKSQSCERRQAVWQLRRYFLEASLGIKRSSFFQIADMWERPYHTATEIRPKPAAHGILNGITYTPKKSCETLGRLACFFDGSVTAADGYCRMGYDDDERNNYMHRYYIFKKEGRPIYAYYIPLDIELDTENGNGLWIDISTIGFERGIDRPVLIDMLSGEVFELKPSYVQGSTIKFEELPYADYPMVICDISAIQFE